MSEGRIVETDPPPPSDRVYVPASPLVTACRGCVFAEYDGPVQTGCRAGRLEALAARPGVTAELVEDPPGVPDPRSFWVLDGTLCWAYRRAPWAGTAEDVVRERRDGFSVRLFLEADGEDPAALYAALADAPGYSRVSVLPGPSHPPRAELAAWLRENLTVPWALEWYRGGPRPAADLLDEAVASPQFREVYYVRARASAPPPPGLPGALRRRCVDEDRPALAFDGGAWVAVQAFAHRQCGGNAAAELPDGSRADTVVEKLRAVGAVRGEEAVVAWASEG